VTLFFHYRKTEFCPVILGGSLNLANHPMEIPQRLDEIGQSVYLLQLGH